MNFACCAVWVVGPVAVAAGTPLVVCFAPLEADDGTLFSGGSGSVARGMGGAFVCVIIVGPWGC